MICNEKDCFAYRNAFETKNGGRCEILTAPCLDKNKKCKFKKPDAAITKGEYYPYINPNSYKKLKA